jgi:hypothetical protein|tara:strand:- start:746 stop:937 length:192 start_codon:yes stop_codon:yes gene_type:complete
MKIAIYVAIEDIEKMAQGQYEDVRWDFNSRPAYEYANTLVYVNYEVYKGLIDLGKNPKQIIKG